MFFLRRRKQELFILAAEPEDAAAIAQIHAISFPRGWSDGEIAAMMANENTRIWTARRRGNAAAGLLGFVMTRQAGSEAEIIALATAPQFRGKGVAGALVEYAVRQLQGEDVTRLVLEVEAGNRAATRLYQTMGFRQVGVRRGYYTSGAVRSGNKAGGGENAEPSDALVMALDLR